ncbi:MAG: hypothetical protein FWC40_00600 [Proteobacteria bacterium]|nr:hypothetical protein [Pseudomonadota bacterium]
MKTRLCSLVCFLLFFGLWASVGWAQNASGGRTEHRGDIAFFGPYEVGNLTVWMMESSNAVDADVYMSLAEAIKAGILVVYETGDVNSLQVENLSKDKPVLILSGEIVKGGKQDRTLATDLLVPPKSGKVAIESFCVEQSRWAPRGSEEVSRFESGGARAVGKDMRNALRTEKSQAKVWSGVAANQRGLSESLNADVQDERSKTSMQLTLENTKVKSSIEEYRKALGDLLAKHPKANGFAFLVGGEFSSAELFHSRAFFRTSFPAMLDAAIVEAVSEASLEKKAHTNAWMDWIATTLPPNKLEETKGLADTFHRVRIYETHFRHDFLKGGTILHSTWDARGSSKEDAPKPATQRTPSGIDCALSSVGCR